MRPTRKSRAYHSAFNGILVCVIICIVGCDGDDGERSLAPVGANKESQSEGFDDPAVRAALLRHMQESDDEESLRKAVQAGLDLNSHRDSLYGGTFFAQMVRYANSKSNKGLAYALAAGADVNARNAYGATPVHEATGNLNPDGMRLLLASGGDVNAVDNDGQTPLHWAPMRYSDAQDRSVKKVQILIEAGAEVDRRDKEGRTPLHLASQAGTPDIVPILLENGADVDARDHNDRTPLHYVAIELPYWAYDTVKVLLDHGARRDARDDDGRTPLEYAKQRTEDAEFLKLLYGK